MKKSIALSNIAIVVAGTALGISAVAFASAHPYNVMSYAQVVSAVAIGVVAGFMIGHHQADTEKPSLGSK